MYNDHIEQIDLFDIKSLIIKFLSTAAVAPELTYVIQKSIMPSCKTPSPVHILHRSLAMQMSESKHKDKLGLAV